MKRFYIAVDAVSQSAAVGATIYVVATNWRGSPQVSTARVRKGRGRENGIAPLAHRCACTYITNNPTVILRYETKLKPSSW
eukprot:8973865-Pyramimonas_sp.AAC.1